MAKQNRQSFKKKEKEKKKAKRREDKLQKKEDKNNNPESSGFDDMIAYVDHNGNIIDSPPDEDDKPEEVDSESIEISIPKKTAEERNKEKSGVVNYYDTQKGFGFINDLDSDERYFFHQSNLIDDVEEGDKVNFTIQKGMRGMDAVNVKVAG
jgi:cold shock CspA family protein